MQRWFYYMAPWALSGLVLLLTACTQPSSSTPPPPPPKVTVSQPTYRDITEWEEYTGRLEAIETVEARARVNGYLQSVNFKDGSLVKKGDLLFVIDPRPYQAELARVRAEVALAMARFDRTEKELARAQLLLRSRAVSQEEVETRASEQRQAQQAVQAARALVDVAQLNVDFTQVRAPISGRISRNFVSVGNLVNSGGAQSTLLTTLVSLDPIYCYFEMDERAYLRDMRQTRQGTPDQGNGSKTPVFVGLTDETGFPHQGVIDFVDNRLDPNTGTITGRAVIPNPTLALTPGLFARVRVPASAPYKALLLPAETINNDLSQQFVFVVDDQNTAQYRRVTLGPLIEDMRVIREGLQPEDWVVVNGIQRVTPGARVDPERQTSSPPSGQAALQPSAGR